MKPKVIALAPLYLVMALTAQAQITIDSLDRNCRSWIYYDGILPQQLVESSTVDGVFFHDLELTEGDFYARSLHNSSVELSGSALTVTGTYSGEVLNVGDPMVAQVIASALLAVVFTVDSVCYLDLSATVSLGGEVWFYDFTTNDYSFDNQGPGTFSLVRELEAGHQYLLQVHDSCALDMVDDTSDVSGTQFSMVVSTEPVATDTRTIGSIKALYR